MGLLDNVFESVGKTFNDASQTVMNKGKELSDLSKFNSLISEEEKKINGLMMQVGKKYLETYADNAGEEFAELVNEYKASLANIEEYKETVKKLKGIKPCPNCGADIAPGALFCPSCGYKMPVPVPEGVTICGTCGAHLPAGSKFCTSCGSPVQAAPVQPQINVAENVAYAHEAPAAVENAAEEVRETVQNVAETVEETVETAAENVGNGLGGNF